MRYILILLLFISCSSKEEKKEPEFEVPQGSALIINDPPKPIAYKKDSATDWVISDSAAVLKVLLNMVEQQYKNASQQQTKK